MGDELSPVGLEDLFAASASGVLRALDARKIGLENINPLDLVKSGFIVDIHIIAGGITAGPFLERVLASGRANPGLSQTSEQG